MDGTLCDVSSIRHLSRATNETSTSSTPSSVNCPPHTHVLAAVKQAYADGHHVIVVTARKDRYKHHTSWWLAINEVPAYALKMRASYDNRPDYEVKRDILRELRESYDIIHAWDDNPARSNV